LQGGDEFEVGRRLARRVDQRMNQKIAAHERRMHAEADESAPVVEACPHERIPDDVICAVITQAEREDSPLSVVVEEHGLPWSRFTLDLADYEGRYRRELARLRWGREARMSSG
jgi:hypothetical protein